MVCHSSKICFLFHICFERTQDCSCSMSDKWTSCVSGLRIKVGRITNKLRFQLISLNNTKPTWMAGSKWFKNPPIACAATLSATTATNVPFSVTDPSGRLTVTPSCGRVLKSLTTRKRGNCGALQLEASRSAGCPSPGALYRTIVIPENCSWSWLNVCKISTF